MYESNNQYYHTCPLCGANLDPGESCDCCRSQRDPGNYHDVNRPRKWYDPVSHHVLTIPEGTPFVCLSDLINDFVPHNKVIYNPKLPYRARRAMLYNIAAEEFHVTLSAEELTQLCQYSEANAREFVEAFKKCILNKK